MNNVLYQFSNTLRPIINEKENDFGFRIIEVEILKELSKEELKLFIEMGKFIKLME